MTIPNISPHYALTLRYTLRGHTHYIYRMEFSPDGRILASPSNDGTVHLWDLVTGKPMRALNLKESVVCVAWSPDAGTLATGGGSSNSQVVLWNPYTGMRLRGFPKHNMMITGIAWSPDGKWIASSSADGSLCLIDAKNGRDRNLTAGDNSVHGEIEAISWSPDNKHVCAGGSSHNVSVWDLGTGLVVASLSGHKGNVLCVAWSPDGQCIASGSQDRTIVIWDHTTSQPRYRLEGHTDRVVSLGFMDNGSLLASLSARGTIIVWRTDTWIEAMSVRSIGHTGPLSSIALHKYLPVMATPGNGPNLISVWNCNFPSLRGPMPATRSTLYVNAKVVLLGDSGVGKSGLGFRIAEGRFKPTEGSTHGAEFWHIVTDRLQALSGNVRAELTLWDLAGQPDYRLTHQLFLDDTDAALLLFDCSDTNDPFRGVPYWAKVLTKHAPLHAPKLLVSSRCDVSPVTVDRHQINYMLVKFGLVEYFTTSAKTGDGVEALLDRVMKGIQWDKLPRTSTPRLFQLVRELFLELKRSAKALVRMEEIRAAVSEGTQEDLDTVIHLLQSRGLVYRLDFRNAVTLVLLKPQVINQYGSSIIQAARRHPLGIGAVAERDVLIGIVPLLGFERLSEGDEMLVLQATVELLIRRDLCFREMGYLVFPSQVNSTRLPPKEPHPRTEVAYHFSGSTEAIYASLVVRLSYTSYFQREGQWKHAAEFTREGNQLGFAMREVEEGTGELEIYFTSQVGRFDRVTFIRFVTDHLRSKGINIEEQIRLYCPKCSKEITNRDAIETRMLSGELDIPCQYCTTVIVIPKSVESLYGRDPNFGQKQMELARAVESRTENEVEQFRADQSQYILPEDNVIHILHLSDLHIENDVAAGVYRIQLETDLIQELQIRRLDYLIISGDITNHSTEEEYRAAFGMVDALVKRFGLDPSRVVVVPGNHDVNWDDCENAYVFIPRRKLPISMVEGQYIPCGETGALLRDEHLYRRRFARFNNHFYKRIYNGLEYPIDYSEQSLFIERPEDRILFLGLNSCWELDHHFRDRASIHIQALSGALGRLQSGKYDGWLKIGIWHHPVTGQEMMNDEFMQLLAVHGFEICMHGHIHESIDGFHRYDDRRTTRIIGAGTFGAPARQQVSGIPLQYNLLTIDSDKREAEVRTRKKEKPNGAWSADARWGKKNDPHSWYRFPVYRRTKDG